MAQPGTMGEEEEARHELEALLMSASANSRLRSLSELKPTEVVQMIVGCTSAFYDLSGGKCRK
jgi:hypothetical protein